MSVVSEEVRLQQDGLAEHVMHAVKAYLTTANSKDANLNLYQLIIEEVEAPLFRTVMEMTRYNQSRAARVLGVSRGTLRTKLKRYFDEEFIGTREE
ncbi:MAG: helix-turn-helix domain-containing protein [Legionellaceae bacterium]|nr:helix-turn-helix domain-containing protein [Legionellaceae bacterium]